MGLFNSFYKSVKSVKELNSTFLVLIPKKEGVKELKDFHLISFTGSVYKILAKMLANRLKKVLKGLISESQNAL